jgi:hypothetical protein
VRRKCRGKHVLRPLEGNGLCTRSKVREDQALTRGSITCGFNGRTEEGMTLGKTRDAIRKSVGPFRKVLATKTVYQSGKRVDDT